MSGPHQEGVALARFAPGCGGARQEDQNLAAYRVGLVDRRTVAGCLAEVRQLIADPPVVGYSPAGHEQASLATPVDMVNHPAALGVRAGAVMGHAGSLPVRVVGVGELPAEEARQGQSSSSE
jgi:hypothetical protein